MGKEVEETIKVYDEIADRYNNVNSNINFMKKHLECFRMLLPKGKVLDLGCGTGRDSLFFIENKYRYIGIDASKGMLAVAKGKSPKAKFVCMDFFHLDFPNKEFDGIWAAASLLHIPKKDINKVLLKIHKILKDEGVMFISMRDGEEKETGFVERRKHKGVKRYFSFYDEGSFVEILKKNNFKILKIDYSKEVDSFGTSWTNFFVQKTS